MEVKEINNKEIWENFLLEGEESKLSSSPFAVARECEEKTFLSSWNWGEFNKMMGNEIWRLGIYENNNLISVALILKIQAKRGTFLFLPHGPVTRRHEVGGMKHEVLKILLDELKKIAREEKASFIRINPIWGRSEENIKIFKDLGFKEAPLHIHPELTWELNITPSEDELLSQMRKTTRYLIRQAQKNEDIKVYQSQNLNDIGIFNKLYQEVVDRHHFIPFSFNYLRNELSAFSQDNQISLFFGKYKGEIISSAIIIFWQKTAFYHHGASSLKYPKVPVSYFLQWEAIKEAKKRDCKIYNFWGIAPIDSEFRRHPWAGLTLYKMGFGGYKKEYVKTQDFPLSKKYWLTYLFEKLRKSKRGL